MSDGIVPKQRPTFVPPAGSPFGMVRRNAFGRAPIQPGLLPMNLLRSHLYPGQGDEVAQGIAEFNANLERGAPIPHLPQNMAFQWNKRQFDGGTAVDPSGGPRGTAASAASLAAAVAWSGSIAKMQNELVVTPRDEREAQAAAEVIRVFSAARPELGPPALAKEVNGEGVGAAFPEQQQLLAAYGQASAQVVGQRVEDGQNRAGFLARAMHEINAQSQKTMGFLRNW